MRSMPATAHEEGQGESQPGRELNPKLLAAKAVSRIQRQRARRRAGAIGIVLMHHEIAPRHGNRETDVVPALGIELFRAQLEHLRRNYEVVPLRELAPRMAQRTPGARIPVAITFDDDLARHLTVAAPALEEFGFAATFFLSGNGLEEATRFWWQDLQAILDRGPDAWASMQQELGQTWPWAVQASGFHRLATTIEALPPDERDEVAERLRALAGPVPADEGLRRDDVAELARRGFEIGFHTLRHYALPTLPEKRLDEAMSEGRDQLEDVAGYRPASIAYPHAKADLRVAEAAQRAGFEIGLVCGGGVATPEQHPLLIDRIDGWANSLAGFAWSLAMPAAAG
jgi:peptidoglycan/xylan/chitin deacetylase (PgdA/CDA1 family)